MKGKFKERVERKRQRFLDWKKREKLSLLQQQCIQIILAELKDFNDFINEARKEFSQCLYCEFYVGDGENGHCTLDDRVDSVGCPKDEWFKKWFGDIT